MSIPGRFPHFLDEWRDVNGPSFTPRSYLNQEIGIPYVIAAQWLYVPHFVEYRGGIFHSEDPVGLSHESRRALDGWFDKYGGDISRVERIGNTLSLWGLFNSGDIDRYDDDLSALARTLARAWHALLRTEFPDRVFRVRVFDVDEYGPQVTFYSEGLRNVREEEKCSDQDSP